MESKKLFEELFEEEDIEEYVVLLSAISNGRGFLNQR